MLAGTNDYTLANANPIRYRGYYFDAETGFYCLGARYYDPQARRFISPDDTAYIDPESVNGLNLYCYCNNDPVNFVDPTGHSWESFWSGVGNWFEDHWVELAIGTAFIVGGAIVTALTCGAGTTAWAAFGSALLSSAIQVGAGIAVGVGLNGLSNVSSGGHFFDNAGDTIASSFMWGGILSGMSQIISGSFRLCRSKYHYVGYSTKDFAFLSPDKLYFDRPGMTVVRFGWDYELALDLGRYGIHAHLFGKLHTPLIPLMVPIIDELYPN